MTHLRYIGRLFGLLCLLYINQALAKPQPTPNLSQLAARVDTANRLFQEKKYEEALPVYQDVYENSQEPTMLFNMGQCYRNLGRFQEAVGSYQNFLDKASKDHELRALAQQLLKEVEARLPAPELPRKSKAHPFYLAAGVAGAFGVTAGAASVATILVAGQKQDNNDIDGARRLTGLAEIFAATADVSLAASLGLVISGFVLSKKEKKITTSLYIGPSQAILRLEF
jgi:tetratricopeptide (TPR) repeat protein